MASTGESSPSREAAMAAAAAATAPGSESVAAAARSAPSSSSFPAAATGGDSSSPAPATTTAASPAPIFATPLATATPEPLDEAEATGDEDSDDEVVEVADLGSRYWLPSCLTEAYMNQLEEGGFLPPKAECSWRLPGEEIVPEPEDGERVVLTSHLIRGMSLPPSAFFSAVLQHYGLQPHNIAPNSILVLAGFQALFEGYLGIVPTVEAFKYCFICRRQTISGGAMATCGSVTFNCRQGAWYPKIPYIDSVKNWTSTFFYCKDIPAPGKTVGIPPFANSPPEHQAHWTEKPATILPEELRLAFRRIEFLTSTMVPPRLDGVDTVLCWLSRRIVPLRHRALKMCEYKAEEVDGTLDSEVLLYRLRELIQPRFVKAAENVAMFTHDNPVPELSTLAEEDLAPRYYNTGASSRKRKHTSTKEMEKRKKAATTEAEDEILGSNIPSKQRAKLQMPKLRANMKATVGRGRPLRYSPAPAPTTPATNTPAVLCPGTFHADRVRYTGSAQSAAEKAAGKKVAANTPQPSAEATANDAVRIMAVKQETARAAKAKLGGSTSVPKPASADWIDPRHTLQTMCDGTKEWYKQMRDLQSNLQKQLEITLTSHHELFTAAENRKNEVKELRDELEMKNAQLASFEEARKKDEDLAKEVAKLKADHAKELEERDLNHGTEVSKLTEQIKNLTDSLAEVTKNSKLQQENHAKAVKLAEETLANHLDEINAVHDQVLAPANLSDAEENSPRLARILKIGEVITDIISAGQAFAAKFYPGEGSDPVVLDAVPELLKKAAEEREGLLRSAARGGAKVALALCKAWYTEADMHQVTEFMPTEDENGDAIDSKEVMASVAGYATRVANMVDLGVFYKEHPDPHAAAGEASSAAGMDTAGGEGEADEGSPKDGGSSPQAPETAATTAATS